MKQKKMHSRRHFLRQASGMAGAALFAPALSLPTTTDVLAQIKNRAHQNPAAAATDEDFWFTVRQAYTSSPNVINLNNGGVSPQPLTVQDAQDRYNRVSNEGPAWYMWHVLGKGRETVREGLADIAGCMADEVAIVRNATEALETLIFGLPLSAGDEVLTTVQDYPSMLNALTQREQRDKIVVKKIHIPVPVETDDEIVSLFEKAITPKTKLILICHMINLTGQILPVRQVCDMARARGIEVIVDGAHSFAHIDFKIADLGCDFFGTSLHKWLSAPFGTGMLYVKQNRIKDIWPLFAPPSGQEDKITKFEHLGTRSFPAELAIGQAISFHNGIGIVRKEARLRYLKNYWVDQVKILERVIFNTSMHPHHSCGIANISVSGLDPGEVQKELFKNYRIYTVAINHEDVKGVRVSPHVYTSKKELDKLVKAIRQIAG